CWLVNSTGKRDGHTPVDHAQEANIGKIKVTLRSQGPNSDWEYLKKLHPVIPVIQAISSHMEREFVTWKRYSHHTTPGDQKGIALLQKAYETSQIHKTPPGRKL
ncbi:uncharacterized protein LAESUDRAFT_633811, partial [Laetiporus sulphureus 93-53]